MTKWAIKRQGKKEKMQSKKGTKLAKKAKQI